MSKISKIELYKQAEKEHKEAERIVDESKKNINRRGVHHSKLQDSYHIVAFSFSINHLNRHEYDTSERLSNCIGEACKHLIDTILNKAVKISHEDVLEKKHSAKLEAEDIIERLK